MDRGQLIVEDPNLKNRFYGIRTRECSGRLRDGDDDEPNGISFSTELHLYFSSKLIDRLIGR
jgi:hypothetical protein